jgi:mevalonate kinase
MITASAPGKIILFGEHAVVYGRPAIAAPVSQLRATVTVAPGHEKGVFLHAPDLDMHVSLAHMDPGDAFAVAMRYLQEATDIEAWPDMIITVRSTIPIASGLGSGAAVAAALIRAVTHFIGKDHLLTNAWVSAITYKVEEIHHGTPSGIDNTVVAYEQPVYFVRQRPENIIEPFSVKRPLHLLIGDTGQPSHTRDVVEDVRRQWQENTTHFEKIFNGCGHIAENARHHIEHGELEALGILMGQNHALLQQMTVSSEALDKLVQAAEAAGALGAKMSGAGRGGNMIALVTPETETAVTEALYQAGATAVVKTIVK